MCIQTIRYILEDGVDMNASDDEIRANNLSKTVKRCVFTKTIVLINVYRELKSLSKRVTRVFPPARRDYRILSNAVPQQLDLGDRMVRVPNLLTL